MSQKATKVVVELHIRAVTCPGVFLVDKDDVYLSVCIMRHYKNTLYHPAVFPLILNEKMRFEKVFRQVHDPAEVAELLESETVTFQLIQQIPPAGESLAYFEVDTRSFLFPEPKLVPSSSGVDREVLMTRAPTFPGIAPRIEFSTRTTIIECSARSEDVINPGVPPRIAPRKANSKRCVKNGGAEARRPASSAARKRTPGGGLAAGGQRGGRPRSRSLSPFRNVSHRSAVRLPVTGREGSRPEPEVNGARSDSKQRSPQHLPQTSVKKELLRRTFPLPPRSRPVADFRGVINRSHSSGWAREPEEAEFPSPGAEDRSHATVTRSPRRGGQGRSRSPESQYMWEEIHDRVRALLTSTRAMRRLAYGATDSEIDDVIVRRCAMPDSCPI
ncbi:spermatogenesis associated 6-like protein [Conger conger]|uniref:spermatogenesis associated 6-like protein n=1 Tax=Conger conger TaxID=82655 RepID=UPI002A5A4542|nr:spermatogenesis associated 6-like protein [Conger conger]